MLNRLPELLINGASLFFIGKEYLDNNEAAQYWQNAYHAEKESTRNLHERLVESHNNMMLVMQQNQDLQRQLFAQERLYDALVANVEDLGYTVTELGELDELEEEDNE